MSTHCVWHSNLDAGRVVRDDVVVPIEALVFWHEGRNFGLICEERGRGAGGVAGRKNNNVRLSAASTTGFPLLLGVEGITQRAGGFAVWTTVLKPSLISL